MAPTMECCDRCGRQAESDTLCEVDGETVCATCMYGDVDPFRIYPIGVVRNDLARGESFFCFGLTGDRRGRGISVIELLPSQEPFMYKLDEEEHLTIVYYLHKSRPVRSRFRRGLDGKEVGVFASRTPDRCSHLAVQEVRLLNITGTTLTVEGLDAIDGSPVLDIKLGRRVLAERGEKGYI